jgi:hypothetical protein
MPQRAPNTGKWTASVGGCSGFTRSRKEGDPECEKFQAPIRDSRIAKRHRLHPGEQNSRVAELSYWNILESRF